MTQYAYGMHFIDWAFLATCWGYVALYFIRQREK